MFPELVPEGGRVDFSNCDFQAGKCFWYTTTSTPLVKEDSGWHVLHRNSSNKPYLPDPFTAGEGTVCLLAPSLRFINHSSCLVLTFIFPLSLSFTAPSVTFFLYFYFSVSLLFIFLFIFFFILFFFFIFISNQSVDASIFRRTKDLFSYLTVKKLYFF